MKTEIDYSTSPAPAFDAVEDIKSYLGSRYDKIANEMKTVIDANLFAAYCGLAGIEGFPIKAWYEHFQGQGAWETATKDLPNE